MLLGARWTNIKNQFVRLQAYTVHPNPEPLSMDDLPRRFEFTNRFRLSTRARKRRAIKINFANLTDDVWRVPFTQLHTCVNCPHISMRFKRHQ